MPHRRLAFYLRAMPLGRAFAPQVQGLSPDNGHSPETFLATIGVASRASHPAHSRD